MRQTSRLDIARYRVMTTEDLQEMVTHPHTYDEDQRKVAKKVLAERRANKAIDRMTRVRVSCDQCVMLSINGVATHEHGCPNVKRSKQGECKECGNAVPHGEQCTCWDYEA